MKQRYKIYAVVIGLQSLFALHIPLFAQDMDVTVKRTFEQYAQKNLQEKIYVHTDRELYLAGDIAWFKTYLVDGSLHKPLDLSKVAYVEILDQQNKPLTQAKIEMKQGEGAGSFFLPVTAASGKYTFRAYTNWMKNAGPDFFFQKTITVINPQRSLTPPAQANASAEPDIRFFPEGGNMVYGLQSKLACKATDAYGKGIEFTGAIVDENNNKVADFRSLHAGIGSFLFTPQSGHRYKAIIETANQKQFTKELPSIYANGHVMRVSASGSDKINVHLENNSGNNNAYLVVHTRQILKFAMQVTVRDGRADITVDKNKLGEGISHFTLFDSNRQPVAERLYFIYPTTTLQLDVRPTMANYGTRKKVDITVKASGNDRPADAASVSMSVFRLDSLETLPGENINSYLLLSSDLKGRIESPSWYFNNVSARTTEAMDNLMLTHGWRRFAWENVLANKEPAISFVPEYNGHLITGRVYEVKTGKPGLNIPGYLSVPGRRTQFYPSVSDARGQLRFEMKDMIGSSEIIVQTDSQRDSLYKIEINNPFSEVYTNTTSTAFGFPRSAVANLVSKSIGTQVQNIYTGARRKQFHYPDLDSTPFYGKPSATYFLDKYTRFTTIEEVLREYVTSLDVQQVRGKFHVQLFDFTSTQGLIQTKQVILFPTHPLVLLDGVPLFDITHLMTMDARKIRKLEIVNHRQFLRGSYFDGVLNWQTYTADLSDLELEPGVVAIDYEGLQPERIFYSPVYDTEEKINSHLPDFRNLLNWTPTIRTDAQGMAHTSFYSSDLKGKYAVVVQGLNTEGKSGSSVAYFEVK
jgi:hypothetical protein